MRWNNLPITTRPKFGFSFARIYQGGVSYTLFASGGTRDADSKLGVTNAGALKFEGYGGHFVGEAGSSLKKIEFDLTKVNPGTALAGNITAYLYTAIDEGDGFYPDTLLATSDVIVASSVATSLAAVPFLFSTPYTMSAVDYCAVLRYNGGDASNYLLVASDLADVSSGNLSYFNTLWLGDNTVSLVFRCYK